MLKIISKFGIWHYAAIAIFSVGLFAFLFSQTNFNFLNAAETTIGTGGAPLPARSSTTYRGCWTNASASYAVQCDDVDVTGDGRGDYSVCGSGDTARCTMDFDVTGDGTLGLVSDYDGQINDTVDHDGNSSTADQLITGYSLDCNTCRWTAPAPASCRDSQPDGNIATDDNDYETNCRYTGCTLNGGTLTCDKDSGATSTCSDASKSWSVSACPLCTAEGSGSGKYQSDRYDYHCTTGAADGKKNKKYKSSTGDCKPPADDIEDCRDCIEDDYSNSCNYNYSQCRSQNGTKAKTCSLVTTECRYTRTFTSSSYTFPAESCRDCTANDYPRTDSNCTWDYSKCQQTEKTKRQTCSLATDQCKYTTTFTSTSYTYPAENCRDCVEGDFTSNCTWDTSTCSSNGTKSKTCGVATNQCRFTTTYPATPHTFTGIACTSCPDSSYTTNCTYGSQCLTSGANAGKVEKTCGKNSPDCAESIRVFYETCPDCAYSAWALDSNQCNPTVENTPAQNGEVWKRTKNTTTSVSYCKALPTDENRSCSECSESQIYNCTPASWSGIQCTNGEKTRTCTKKALAIGNPGCSLPTQTRQRAITGNDTVYGQQSLTTGCSSGEGSSLPAGQSGSTMINISGSWAGSTNLFHNYNGADKRIGIGTTLPNTTLEIVSPDTTKSTQLRITDTNPAGATATTNPELQLQYGTGNNHWGMYVSNVKTTTGAIPNPPQTIISDKSLRIWNQSDLVRIKTDGTLYTSQICLTSTVTTDEAAGSSKCITSWPTGGGGGEQLWTKNAETNEISYSEAAVKIGNANGLGIIGGNKYTYFKGASQETNITYVLPATISSKEGKFLKLGSSGALSWDDTGAPDLAQYQVNNLVVNGGFENPYGGIADRIGGGSIVNSEAHSGQFSLKKGGNTTLFIPVRQNTKYSASFWIKGDGLSSDNFGKGTLILSRCASAQDGNCNTVDGETDIKFPIADSYDWTYVSYKNFDSKNYAYLRLGIYGPNGNFYIDDIALYEAPSSFVYSDRFLTMSGNQGMYGKLGINYMPTHQSDPVFVVLSRNHISSGSVTLTVSAGSVNATLNNYSGGLLVQPGDFIYIPSLGAKKGVGIRSGPDILSDRSWQVTLSDPFPSAVTSQSFMIIQQLAGFSGLDSSKNGAGGEVVITGDGRVGIGGEPQTKLHVSGGYSWGTAISLDATGVKKENPNSVDSYIDNTVGSRWDLISTGGDPAEGIKKFLIKDVGANKVRLTIDKDGNVGINTTAPTRFLEIIGVGGSVGIGVNTTTTNKNVLLEMDSLSQGFLPPRMTSDQMGAIPETKPVGLTIYNTTDKEYKVYDGTVWKAMGLPLGTAQGQTLWWDNADTAKKWVADNKLTIANNGSVSVGTATVDETEVSRFIVKDKETSGTKGFYVGFEGNNTTLSTTPYPRLGASVKIDFYNPKDSFKKGLEVVEGNKIKLTYFISNTGTRKLKVKSVTDTHCPNSMTQVYKNGSNTINVGDTDGDGILKELPSGTATAAITNPPTPATEWWVYTCTTGAVLDAGISMATSTVSANPIKIDNSNDAIITDTAKWKATFTTIGVVPAQQLQSASAETQPRTASSETMAVGAVTNASATIVTTKFGAPSGVTIAWSNSPNATSYDVYRRTRGGFGGGWSRTKLDDHQSPVMDYIGIPKDIKDIEYQIVAVNSGGEVSITVPVTIVQDSTSVTERYIEPHKASVSSETKSTPPETPLQTYTTTQVAPKAPLPKPESVPTPTTAPLPASNPTPTPTTTSPRGGVPSRGGGVTGG